MNRHTLRHGDVVVGDTDKYRLYVCADKNDDTILTCVSLNYDVNYGGTYKAGAELCISERFVCNLMDIVCANKL